MVSSRLLAAAVLVAAAGALTATPTASLSPSTTTTQLQCLLATDFVGHTLGSLSQAFGFVFSDPSWTAVVSDGAGGSVLQLTTDQGDVPVSATLPIATTREVDLSFELNFLSGDSDFDWLRYWPNDGGDWASVVVVTNSSDGSTRVVARLDTRIATGNYNYANVLASTGWLPYSVRPL